MVHTAQKGDKYVCSKCGSSHVDIYQQRRKKMQSCLDCGKEEKV